MKPLVIYHANCADGFGAAFAAWLKFGEEVEYVAQSYGMPPEKLQSEILGREVYILDFSFPKPVMDAIFTDAQRVVWLDHHKTAFEMYGLPLDKRHEEIADRDLPEYGFMPYHKSHVSILDNSKSGAMIAWEYFHPGKEIPMLIKHIDDYDRWQFKIEGTKEFNKALWSYAPWSFTQWKNFFPLGVPTIVNWRMEDMYKEGAAILRAHDANVQAVVKGAARSCRITKGVSSLPAICQDCRFFEERSGRDEALYYCNAEDWELMEYGWREGISPAHGRWEDCPIEKLENMEVIGLAANCPPHLSSDVGHALANQSGTYGLLWYINKENKCLCSLRSNGDYDVSAIAKAFGGGGHKNAAGFEVPISILLDWIK